MDKDVKIFIVDDEERIRRLLKMYLEREEYSLMKQRMEMKL